MRKFVLLLLVAVTVSVTVSAQTIKYGRVNTQEIISLMPETDSAQVKIQAHATTLQERVDFMRTELEKKYAAFQKEATTLQGIIAEQRQKEIVDLQSKLEQFSQDAQRELEQVRMQLTQPIFTKVQSSIDKVSKINLITLVIDESQPLFLYMDKTAIKDLNPLVRKDLKISDKKVVKK